MSVTKTQLLNATSQLKEYIDNKEFSIDTNDIYNYKILFQGTANTVGQTYELIDSIFDYEYLYVKIGLWVDDPNYDHDWGIHQWLKVDTLKNNSNRYMATPGSFIYPIQNSPTTLTDVDGISLLIDWHFTSPTTFTVDNCFSNGYAEDSNSSEHFKGVMEIIGINMVMPQVAVDQNKDITNLLNYSYDEQQIGTWVDGKPLYQKTIHVDVPTASTPSASGYRTVEFSHNIENVDLIWVSEGYYHPSTLKNRDTYFVVMPNLAKFTSNINTIANNAALRVNLGSDFDGITLTGDVTLKYTKTTDVSSITTGAINNVDS